MTDLIFFEGLPGSGKSESGRNLAENLTKFGRPAKFYLETDPENPLHTGTLDPMGAAFEDVHLQYTIEEFAETSLSKYKELASTPLPGTTIFESFPIQSHIRVLLQMNAAETFINRFWSDLQDTIEPSKPALIFFEEDDPEGAMRRITEHRGQRWTEYIVAALVQSPYMVGRRLRGKDGLIQMMCDYNALMSKLYATWRFDKLALAARPADYLARDKRILDWFVNL